MSPAKTASTVTDRLTTARQDEDAAKERLNHADADLKAAVESQDFDKAAQAKVVQEAAREALIVASAHVEALQSGLTALEQQRAAERQVLSEHEARKHAAAQYEQAYEREAATMDELQQHLAEVEPAYEALRRVLQNALEVERQLGIIRMTMDQHAKAAGFRDPALPPPTHPNHARNRIDGSLILRQVMQSPATH